MGPIKIYIRFFVVVIAYSTTTFFTLTGARSNGLNGPFSLPPLGSIAPLASPHNYIPAPLSIYPPSTPNLPFQSPPPSSPHAASSTPAVSPGLSPPEYVPSPPSTAIRTPPPYGPSPPTSIPIPPVVLPPTAVPPPPHKKSIWCVAKPTVTDPVIQDALDYACGSGADCKAIQSNGHCFQPNTLFSHASYAFNSYWQKTKAGGGTCDFGGTAMLVSKDPSFDDCRFIST